MIEPDRPICIMQPIGKQPYDEFTRTTGKWTLMEEPYSASQYDWEACSAEIRKTVLPEDRKFPDTDYAYAKCMEPAVYYVSIANQGIVDSPLVFCEYHRPRVKAND